MKVYGGTDTGRVRERNEDVYLVGNLGSLTEKYQYALVCDGMGGPKAGDVASGLAANMIVDRLEATFQHFGGTDAKSIHYALECAISGANLIVYDTALSDPKQYEGMGTTAVIAIVKDPEEEKKDAEKKDEKDTKNKNDTNKKDAKKKEDDAKEKEDEGCLAVLAHVGDSRAYLVSHDSIQQVTRDHSLVQEKLDNGEITEEQAKNHPERNVITRALGTSESVLCDINEVIIPPGSALLLCSDGLTDMVSTEFIQKTLVSYDPKTALDMLISQANMAGGRDNITVALISKS